MAGGYGEDRWVQGGRDAGFYALRRWACVDTFVYFSHSLVTIPPPGWINAAHSHGVRVLGTLITEWEPGAAACAQLFGSADAAEAAAHALARVAQHYCFEGWLVNIENSVEPAHIPHLLHFLRALTARMREVAPGRSQVMWYDAVTTEGKLEWQNSLTDLNQPFFDACDALWVNYTWKEGTPAAVEARAGDRAAHVYLGVDCFGRGTYGGGGFRCDAALRACLERGLSAALFATGWPYEGDCGPDAPSCWRQRDALFWDGIEAAWNNRKLASRAADGAGGCSSAASSAAGLDGKVIRRPALPLPLWTNFCPGSGAAMCLAGRQVCSQPWYNLSLQTLQPLLDVQASGSAGSLTDGGSSGSSGSASGTYPVQADMTEDAAFSGSGSVRLRGTLRPGQRATIRLFETATELSEAGTSVRLTAAVCGSVQARLVLRLQPGGSTGAAGGTGHAEPEGGSASADGPAAIELIPLLFGGKPGAAVEEAGADALGMLAGARAGSSLLSLRAAPSVHPAVHPLCRGGDTSGAPAEGPHWQTFHFFLGTDMLPALGVPAVLAGVDVVLLGADGVAAGCDGSGSGPPPRGAFELSIGELSIEAGPPSCVPEGPAGVQQLRCDSVQICASPSAGGDAPGRDDSSNAATATLAAQLEWQPPPGGARCYHVWCAFDKEAIAVALPAADGSAVAAAAAASDTTKPQWLGAACADGFVVADLPLLPGAATVTFFVQPMGWNGLLQELAAAACVQIGLSAAG